MLGFHGLSSLGFSSRIIFGPARPKRLQAAAAISAIVAAIEAQSPSDFNDGHFSRGFPGFLWGFHGPAPIFPKSWNNLAPEFAGWAVSFDPRGVADGETVS
jgi:hypothetical protein